LLGHEQMGDEPTSHLQTDLATIVRAHSLLRTLNISSYSGSVDLWVSDRDATIRRIKADISDGKDQYRVDLTFSNFNGAVQIEQPATAP
jgi:outer membrane lipoprotein-sorting protein